MSRVTVLYFASLRDAAGVASEVVDQVKARVPIWKHEGYVEGEAGWLHPRRE